MSATASRILIILLLLIFAQSSPLHAQPTAPNRGLEPDGKGSFVELSAQPVEEVIADLRASLQDSADL